MIAKSLPGAPGKSFAIMEDGPILPVFGEGFSFAEELAASNGNHATMQSDGNLVVYNGATPLWQSGTGGQCGALPSTSRTTATW